MGSPGTPRVLPRVQGTGNPHHLAGGLKSPAVPPVIASPEDT